MSATDATPQATSYGERLLRSPDVTLAAGAVHAIVQAQVMSALQGPVGTALAASVDHRQSPAQSGQNGTHPQHLHEAQTLLGAAVPRMFICVGAALTTAFVALAEGDETRVAGALLCAQGLLFPDDPLGVAAVAGAAHPALDALPQVSAGAPGVEAALLMQQRVAAETEALERALLQVLPNLQVAALSSYSWKQATGGAGPSSDALTGHFGPFLDGLLRWAFYVEAALTSIRQDDWARAGAALVTGRRVTASG